MSKPIQLDKTQTGDFRKGTTDHVTSDSGDRNITVPRQNGKKVVQKKHGNRKDNVDSQINGQHGSRKRRGNRPKNVESLQTRPNAITFDNMSLQKDRHMQDTTISPRTTQNIDHKPIDKRPIDRPTDRPTTQIQNAHNMPIDRLDSHSPKSTNNNNHSGSPTMEEGETELQRKYAAARALSEMATGLFISTSSEIHTTTQSTASPRPHPPPPPHTTSPTTPPTERGFPGHSPPPPLAGEVAVGSGARTTVDLVGDRHATQETTDQVIVIAPIAPTTEASIGSMALTPRQESRREPGGGGRGGALGLVGESPPVAAPVSSNIESSKAPLTYQFYQSTTSGAPPRPPLQHHRFHISPHQHHHLYPHDHPVHTGKSPSLDSPSTTVPADLGLTRRVTEEGGRPQEAQLGSAQRGVSGQGGGGEVVTTQELNHLEMNFPHMMHSPTGGVVYRLHQMKTEPPDQHLRGGVHPTGMSSFGRDQPEVAQNLCMRDMARTTTSTVTSNSENKDVPKSLPLKKRKYVTEEPNEIMIESPPDIKTLPRQHQPWEILPVNHSQSKMVMDAADGHVRHSNGDPPPSIAGYQRLSRQHIPMNPRGMAPHYVTSSMTNGGMSLTSGHRIVSPTEHQRTNMPLDFSSSSNRIMQAASHSVGSLRVPMATTIIRNQETAIGSHNLNERRKMSTLSHLVKKISASHDRKFISEEWGAGLKKMAAAAFASGSSSGPPQQRFTLGRLPTKPPRSLSPITPPVTIPSFLPPSVCTADIPKDNNHHPHLKRKGSSQPHNKPKVFVGTERTHTEPLSGRKAGRDGMWHPDGGGRVRLVMTDIDSSMKQPQTRHGARAGTAGWEQVEARTKRRAGTVAGGGAGVEGETVLPSSTEAEAANHGAGAGAAEVKDEESSPSETLRINPQDSLRMLRECSLAVRPDEDGDLPLHVAVVQGNLKTIHKLIQLMAHKSVPIDYCNLLRQTPLHLAVITKQPDIVQTLLSCGASPNYSDRVGNTSVHLAVKHRTLPCLNSIIKYSQRKPNLNQKNFEGLAPLHVAVQIKDEILTQAELETTKKEIMKTLLVGGAETDITDGKSGRTPLHHSVETQQIKLVEMLLEHHSKVNVQSYAGNTALHTASERNYKNIMQLLMHHGADTTIKNANHETYNSVSKETKPSVTGREASFSQASPTIRIPKVENVEELNPPVTMKSGLKRSRTLRLKSLDGLSVSLNDMTVSSPRVQQQGKSPELLGAHSAGQQPSEPTGLRTKLCSPTEGIHPIHSVKCEGQINEAYGSKSEGHIMWVHGSPVHNAPAVKDQPSVKSEKLDTSTHVASEHCTQEKSTVGPTLAIPCSVMSSDNTGMHKIPHSLPTDPQQGFPQLPTPRVGQALEDHGVIKHYGSPAPISYLTSMVNHLQRTDEPMKALRVQQTLPQTSVEPQPRKVRVARTVYLPNQETSALSSDYESVMHQRKIELRNHSGLSLQNLPGGQYKETEINDGKVIVSNSEALHVSGLQNKTIATDCLEPMHTRNPERPQIVVSHKDNNERHSQTSSANDTKPTEECAKETSMPALGSVIVRADKMERKGNMTSKPQSMDEVMTAILDKACLTELRQPDGGSRKSTDGSQLDDERCKESEEVEKELSVPKLPAEIKDANTDSFTLPPHDKTSVATALGKHQSPGPEKKNTPSVLPNVPESPDIFPRLVICDTEEATAAPGKKRRKIDEIGIMLASSSQKKISSSSHSAGTDEQIDNPNTNSELKADGMKKLETDECTMPLPPSSDFKDAESNPTDSNETVLNEFTGQLLVKEKSGSSGDIEEQDRLVDNPASSPSPQSKS